MAGEVVRGFCLRIARIGTDDEALHFQIRVIRVIRMQTQGNQFLVSTSSMFSRTLATIV
jgi:hypothetical protein